MSGGRGVKNDHKVSDLVKTLDSCPISLTPSLRVVPSLTGEPRRFVGSLVLEPHRFGGLALLPFLGMAPPLLLGAALSPPSLHSHRGGHCANTPALHRGT